MSELKYKLLALDMDGTLLNDNHEITQETAKWIQIAIRRGVHVCLSTGRAVFHAMPYAVQLGLETPMVTVNGSEVWKAPHDLHMRHLMDPALIRQMQEIGEKYNSWYWAYSVEELFNRDRWTDNIESLEWLKFGFNTEVDEVRHQIMMELQQMGGLQMTNSSPVNIEINPAGISKASGVAEVCKLLGIQMSEVVAVGDSLNDLSVIEAVGLGVAMGNAQEQVKEAADLVIASNNEDGIAHLIREHILKGE
ncbi:phosphoglycolate phosphatase [Paenibacillus sp. PCH8]|uniref:Cof-type HAD-IIB family hydrolase n=1 Tax=Paenibacillus sp. PCH8 TaxID=2066524 RepID=UPI000CFA6C69|nr:Cof-type HAD-IIB family hydrolase [Paenibacillus sp. PCH8]PQP80969.1 phosphoglycolate phosphatase [Paenibacillus sp. PCH8]